MLRVGPNSSSGGNAIQSWKPRVLPALSSPRRATCRVQLHPFDAAGRQCASDVVRVDEADRAFYDVDRVAIPECGWMPPLKGALDDRKGRETQMASGSRRSQMAHQTRDEAMVLTVSTTRKAALEGPCSKSSLTRFIHAPIQF